MPTNISDLLGYQFQGAQGVQGLQGVQGVQGVIGSQGTTTLGIATESGIVGTGVTLLDLRGPGISTVTVAAGIATINITGGNSSGTNPWVGVSTNYTAMPGDQVIADTSSGTWTLTLPSSPNTGDIVRVADGDDWSTNNLIIARNGSTIDGYNQDFTLDIKGITVDFIYDGTTWELFANTGPESKEALWTTVTSDVQAYSRDRLLAIASTQPFTIVLPDENTGRTTGSFIRILDGANWSSIGVTIGRNGATIEGQAQDMYLDIGNIEVEFAYDGTTWNVYPSVTASNQVAAIDDIYSTTLYPVMVSGVGTGYTARINTTNFVFDAFNGRLGIGTTNPQNYELFVNGDINFEGDFYQNGSPFVASRWTAGAGTSIYRNSFVGVGTTNPQYDLDVNGDINFNGTFYQNGSQFVASRWTAGAGTTIYRDSFVGIGITNSQYPLHVVGSGSTTLLVDGDARITGILSVGSGTITIDGNNNSITGLSTIGIGTVIDIVPYDTINSGTLSFEASAGQLFSITNNLTSGSIFSINDVSGLPTIDVDANGTIQLNPYGGHTKLNGVVETVSAATTYNSSGGMVLELDVRKAKTYTYTMPTGANIGIVSFKNMPADLNNPTGVTVTVIITQNSAGTGNTTPTTGIGTNCFVTGYATTTSTSLAGISTRGLVGSAVTTVLSSTGSDVDFVSFYVNYNGNSNTTASSYKIYVRKDGEFRRGTIGV